MIIAWLSTEEGEIWLHMPGSGTAMLKLRDFILFPPFCKFSILRRIFPYPSKQKKKVVYSWPSKTDFMIASQIVKWSAMQSLVTNSVLDLQALIQNPKIMISYEISSWN